MVFTWYAAVITATVVAFPLMYKTALGAFEQVDSSLLQVAQTLGASKPQIFWRILLPLSVPDILAGTESGICAGFRRIWRDANVSWKHPGQTQTIPMAIYFAVEAGATGEAWLWVMVIMTIHYRALLQLANFTLSTAFTAQRETSGLLGGSGSSKSMTLRCGVVVR